MNTAFYLLPSMLVSATENANAKVMSSGDPHLPLCPSGKYLRLKRIHFQLPYDVMWQWQHDQVNEHGWGGLRSLSDQKVADVISIRRICVAAAGPAADRPPEEEAALL